MRCVLFLVEEFSEWDETCQRCKFFRNCQKEFDKDETINKSSSGDNFPNYDTIHLRKMLNEERTDMIQKLLQAEIGRITKDDITDTMIDVEIYNLQCRKAKIKERYKKKRKI